MNAVVNFLTKERRLPKFPEPVRRFSKAFFNAFIWPLIKPIVEFVTLMGELVVALVHDIFLLLAWAIPWIAIGFCIAVGWYIFRALLH